MTTYTCPDGHTSSSDDYCDVCGSPMAAGGAAAPAAPGTPVAPAAPAAGGPPAPPPVPGGAGAPSGSSLDLDAPAPAASAGAAPSDQLCPNCGSLELPDALFCEHCGYDFVTGQLPRPLDPPAGMPVPAPPTSPAVPPVSPPADPPVVPAPDDAGQDDPGDPAAAPAPALSPPEPAPLPAPQPDPQPLPDPVGDPVAVLQPPPSAPGPVVLPPAARTPDGVEWVVEVWVDPDWHAAQDVNDPCPSAGMPAVVPLRQRSVLVGRTSTSRNIHPDVDITGDTGVSRRHAQLTSDGMRWWIEDLGSANGTYVGGAGQPLPADPIVNRVELLDDGRVYLGAWTRLVVRKASASERAAG